MSLEHLLSTVRCESYARDQVREAVRRLLEPFGGFEGLVRPGMKVFLKPNMLSAKQPTAAVTTHPAVVEAVAEGCRGRGASVFIGDSPPLTLRRIEEYWENSGYREVAERTGAVLVALEKETSREVTLAGPTGPVVLRVTDWAFQADLTVNLCKLKTHNLTVITGGVKNHFGLVPGMAKAQLHLRFPRGAVFGALMADLAAAVPMGLTIMDGIEGMDGQGPAGGRVIKTGCLLASRHPVAVDLGFCAVAGLDPATIPTLRRCRETGFGPTSLAEVDCRGVDPRELRFPGFHAPPPPLLYQMPESLYKLASRLVWARPMLIRDRCIRCGACVRVCASRAVAFRPPPAAAGSPATPTPNEERMIRFNYRRCISCFCCMEVCPKEAIEMETSLLVKMAIWVRQVKRRLQGKPV